MGAKLLQGKRIAVPETRELNKLVGLLIEEGAEPLAYPLVGISDTPDQAPVEAWVRALADDQLDDVIFLTGEGVRRLCEVAVRLEIRDAFVAGLSRTRTITRGPKPAAALHALGLRPARPARVPTSQGVIQELSGDDLSGRRFGVQLYAENASQDLVTFLTERGALVRPVTPYVYCAGSEDDRVAELIDRLIGGTVDAVAFTSSSQVDRLFQVAGDRNLADTLLVALGKVVVAAVGPTCAAALTRRGAAVAVVPERSFFMRPLVEGLARAFLPGPPTPPSA